MHRQLITRTVRLPLISSKTSFLNPNKSNGLSHPYHLDEPIFIFRGIRSGFSFLFHFSMKFLKANIIAPDGTPRFAASHLGLFCLPKSHKKDARLKCVRTFSEGTQHTFSF